MESAVELEREYRKGAVESISFLERGLCARNDAR